MAFRGAREADLDRGRRDLISRHDLTHLSALRLSGAEARIEPRCIVEEGLGSLELPLVLEKESAAVGDERRERARWPLLDRIPLSRRQCHPELLEEAEDNVLLEGQ